MHLLGSPNLRFTHPFFHNQIKRRIAMITSSQQPKYQYFRKVMVLPLLFIIAGLFAFTYKQKQESGTKEAGLTGEITLKDSLPNSVREEKKKLPSPELIIINGKKYTEEEAGKLLIGKEIRFTAGDVIYTKAGDTLAIKEYGPKAKNGVIELREVKITKGVPLEGNILNEQVIEKPVAKPLYVIDGIVQPKNTSTDVLQTLNPEDIQSVNILKDIKAVTKYGDDAVHGVVEINTKKMKEVVLEKVKGVEIKEVTADELSEVVVVGYASPKAEAEPSFPGGQTGWRKFLERNLNPSLPVDNGASAGTYTVYVQFIVDQQGHISDIKALTEHGFGMEEEVIRVLKSGPVWVPGMKNGKAIKAFKKQPVTFQVIEEENEPDLKEVVVVGYQKEKPVTADIDKLSPIYPNPANNNVTISYNTKLEGPGEIRVLDMLGNSQQVVKTNYAKGLNNLNINVSSLTKGTYIIVVLDADKKITRRYKMIKE
ncbi:MAG: T9SS type A sorting domain-containing protein [Bacteroidota bacterium]